MKEINEKLTKLIAENPDAEIKVIASVYNMNYDCSFTALEITNIIVKEFVLYNDELWLDRKELKDELEIDLCDKPEYQDLPRNVFHNKIEEYIDKNFTFKKYICITTG